jgi:hypothetical protein
MNRPVHVRGDRRAGGYVIFKVNQGTATLVACPTTVRHFW